MVMALSRSLIWSVERAARSMLLTVISQENPSIWWLPRSRMRSNRLRIRTATSCSAHQHRPCFSADCQVSRRSSLVPHTVLGRQTWSSARILVRISCWRGSELPVLVGSWKMEPEPFRRLTARSNMRYICWTLHIRRTPSILTTIRPTAESMDRSGQTRWLIPLAKESRMVFPKMQRYTSLSFSAISLWAEVSLGGTHPSQVIKEA